MTSDAPRRDPVPEPSDLARRAREGSAEALAALYHAHGPQVYRAAYRIVGNRADAEDVLHDVFVGLPTALGRYRETGRLSAWLKTLAVRTALMRLRRRRLETSFRDAVDPAAPDATATGIVDRLAVAQALDRMPATLRDVFVLKEVEGYAHREIAGLLGISVGASEVRLHRAWAALNAVLGTREAP